MSTGYPTPLPAQTTASPLSPGAKLQFHLHRHTQPMDGRPTEYPQSDQASTAPYPPGQDPRSSNFSPSATPTSEYGINSSSARSGSFPEYIQRAQYPPGAPAANAGAMAQATNPSIAAATSPSYPPHGQYSPYTPQHEMSHYPGHPGVYGRPDWAGGQYPPGPPHAMAHYGHSPATSGPPAPPMVSPGGHPLSTVYSFVPIPGAQQHKRPRRRYEEIERMYKCGWNGCEKAYGTLNHLNAHVTMQAHGAKRTPEEFKEIRKEWKAKKKEEEAARKADEERARTGDGRQPADNAPEGYGQMRPMPTGTPQIGGPQLPPIGYQPAAGAGAQPSPQYGAQSPALEGIAQYAGYNSANSNSSSYPQSPYGQPNQVYQQHDNSSQSAFQQ